MKTTIILAVAIGCADTAFAFSPFPIPSLIQSNQCSADPKVFSLSKETKVNSPSTKLFSSNPKPLATEGDWSAYLDEETTGYVYYFNGVTGESTWEPPTNTFPKLDLPGVQNEGLREEQSMKQENKVEEKSIGGGLFAAVFGGGESAKREKVTFTEKVATQPITSKEDFFNEIEDVIAEAEEAIKIAEKVEEQPPKKQFSFLSAFGFGGGEKASAVKETDPAVDEKKLSTEGENLWVEGLKNLFQKTYENFSPPEIDISSNRKVVVAEKKPVAREEPKATVSDSDFLDVVWGAETSPRPTLNIAEMMKAFQVEAKEEETIKVAEETRTLTLDSSLQVKPHPEKVAWGGEDAGFSVGRTFGIFDGVSGADKVRGKKLYSVSLAESMRKKSGKNSLNIREITSFMAEAKALADNEATGASTAVVASVGEDNVLRALNLGDSVCLVLRNGAVAARTREIIHYFDCPYQLGDDSPDQPKDGTTLQAEIFPGDIIVAGSDGVFDNLSDSDVSDLVASCPPRSKASFIAKKLIDKSRAVSLDKNAVTPYSRAASGKRGYDIYKSGKGGKIDDISCVVVKAS